MKEFQSMLVNFRQFPYIRSDFITKITIFPKISENVGRFPVPGGYSRCFLNVHENFVENYKKKIGEFTKITVIFKDFRMYLEVYHSTSDLNIPRNVQ